jgi:hypothetical protein
MRDDLVHLLYLGIATLPCPLLLTKRADRFCTQCVGLNPLRPKLVLLIFLAIKVTGVSRGWEQALYLTI